MNVPYFPYNRGDAFTYNRGSTVKTFLRSTKTEDRLESLALISIEHEIAVTVEYGTLIDSFSLGKSLFMYKEELTKCKYSLLSCVH